MRMHSCFKKCANAVVFLCFGHVGAKTSARDGGVLFGHVGSEFVLFNVSIRGFAFFFWNT